MNNQNDYVSSEGIFLSHHGVSGAFLLKHRGRMKYIEDFINSSILGTYYKAIPSNTYSITIFNIWKEKYPLTKLQIYRLKEISGNIPDRYDYLLAQISENAELAVNILVKDLAMADHFLQSRMSLETTVICRELYYHNNIFLIITWLDPKINDYIKTITSGLGDIFQTIDGVYTLGILLGYKYKVIDVEHIELVSQAIDKLGKMINIFDSTIIVEQPRIIRFSKLSDCNIFK